MIIAEFGLRCEPSRTNEGYDSDGALVIGGLCYRGGKKAFEKAGAGNFACTCGGSCKKEEKEG